MGHVAGPGIQVEAYVSVDVETSGPNPSDYDMLAIGACLVDNPACGFYVELQPVTGNAIPGSLAISDLSLDDLRKNGLPPAQALNALKHGYTQQSLQSNVRFLWRLTRHLTGCL